MTATTNPKPLMQVIIEAACTYFDTSHEILLERKRDEELMHCRKIIVYILRKEHYFTLKKIAKELGYKDIGWVYSMIEDVEEQKQISLRVSHDIKNINQIVSTLV